MMVMIVMVAMIVMVMMSMMLIHIMMILMRIKPGRGGGALSVKPAVSQLHLHHNHSIFCALAKQNNNSTKS